MDTVFRDVTDDAGWDLDVVNVDDLARVWQVEGIVQGGVGGWVLEAVQVPVCLRMSVSSRKNDAFFDTYVRAEHDRRLLRCSDGGHLDVPLVWSQGVGHIGNDFSRETLHAIWIDEGEGDGVSGVSDDSPVAPVPSR